MLSLDVGLWTKLYLTPKYSGSHPECREITWMPSKDKYQIQLLQGTLKVALGADTQKWRTLAAMVERLLLEES
jgi:hypothetical protein